MALNMRQAKFRAVLHIYHYLTLTFIVTTSLSDEEETRAQRSYITCPSHPTTEKQVCFRTRQCSYRVCAHNPGCLCYTTWLPIQQSCCAQPLVSPSIPSCTAPALDSLGTHQIGLSSHW
jgi:hypothetical protein